MAFVWGFFKHREKISKWQQEKKETKNKTDRPTRGKNSNKRWNKHTDRHIDRKTDDDTIVQKCCGKRENSEGHAE